MCKRGACTPLPPARLPFCTKRSGAASAGLGGNPNAKRTKPYLKTDSVLAGCCRPTAHFAPVRLVARRARSSARLGSARLARTPRSLWRYPLLRLPERRDCVVCHIVAGLFFLSSMAETQRRSQRAFLVRGFVGLEGRIGERREGRKHNQHTIHLNISKQDCPVQTDVIEEKWHHCV